MCRNLAACLLPLIATILFAGCTTAADHQRSLGSSNEREMTVGIVQKEIRAGMSQADVAEALGSPNIVTKDGEDKETWIYDKIATEASYSKSGSDTRLKLGILTGDFTKESGAASLTQKTLTVVIKFDAAQKVSSFSYHSSKF